MAHVSSVVDWHCAPLRTFEQRSQSGFPTGARLHATTSRPCATWYNRLDQLICPAPKYRLWRNGYEWRFMCLICGLVERWSAALVTRLGRYRPAIQSNQHTKRWASSLSIFFSTTQTAATEDKQIVWVLLTVYLAFLSCVDRHHSLSFSECETANLPAWWSRYDIKWHRRRPLNGP